ncbi:MAG: 4-(cytidine 5'-diphospho)-2-C-methyl-D-erythritol kinase [Bacteroidaceae bacterium]|nr:4-(cytidine 5'-diphospho)-2-C-methyl-D-erythritol kinase [Bacteroidaceae bacterium]
MIVFPNAKINLGLRVTRRRPDGYHDLDTIFYPIPLCDALEVVPMSTGQQVNESTSPQTDIKLHLVGAKLDGCAADDNLVVRAYRLLKAEFAELPAVEVWLYKHIPSGAGLGGGSADATFMLRLLNTMFALGLTDERLEARAATLGADCPFFVRNAPVRATGTGNIFSPVTINLKGYRIVVVKPPVFVSTREAFGKIDELLNDERFAVNEEAAPAYDASPSTLTANPSTLTTNLSTQTNDFEQSVFPLHPELAEIKETLYRSGAVYASMSGSGSALYGLFPANVPCPLTPLDFPGCFFWQGILE